MAVKIRLARGGSKKRPYYWVVVADSRSPRDGRFIETIGSYNPLLKDDNQQRVTLKQDRVAYWLGVGAEPTDRVQIFINKAGIKALSTEEVQKLKGEAPSAKAAKAAAPKKAPAKKKAS